MLIGIAILIGIVFLRPLYASYIENDITLTSLTHEDTKLQKEYLSLKAIRDNINTAFTPEKQARIAKLAKPYNTSDIIEIIMINNFTKESASQWASINISSVSVWEWKKLPNGLSLWTVNIALQWKTVADIIAYITALTQDSAYAFTLDNISLPIDTAPETTTSGGYALNISLWVYYYE